MTVTLVCTVTRGRVQKIRHGAKKPVLLESGNIAAAIATTFYYYFVVQAQCTQLQG